MNVLVLMADQHRWDTAGCCGHPIVQTPHIDSLAANGVRCANAFTVSPLCIPSRVSWHTSAYPHTHGAFNHPSRRHRSGLTWEPYVNDASPSLVCQLRDAGYQTHASGYLGADECANTSPKSLGYETAGITDPEYRATTGEEISRRYHLATIYSEMWEPSYFNVEGLPFPFEESKMWDSMTAEDAIRFLESRDTSRPFFLYAGFRAPHPPWCAPPRFHNMYSPDNVGPLPQYKVRHERLPRRLMERFDYFDIQYYSEEMVRRSIAGYYGVVSYMDDCMGRILGALDRLGLRDDTLIVYSSDHGENLYRHGLCEKHSFFEDAVRIPLIFSLPAKLPHGETNSNLISNIDVMPTILSLAGLESPNGIEGRRIFDAPPREQVFAEYYHTLDPSRMVRDARWKYIHTDDDICQLYDLERDPDERHNLAFSPEYAERVRAMDDIVMRDWEIPEVPPHSTWNDLHERKQRQLLAGLDIINVRPPPLDA
jgi:choline-sulfatase